MSKMRVCLFFVCLAAGLAVPGCQVPGSTASPAGATSKPAGATAKPAGGLNAKSSTKSDTKAASKPLPADTIPSAKEVGL